MSTITTRFAWYFDIHVQNGHDMIKQPIIKQSHAAMWLYKITNIIGMHDFFQFISNLVTYISQFKGAILQKKPIWRFNIFFNSDYIFIQVWVNA